MSELDASFAVHDALLSRRSLDIWVGAEPTFTRADSLDPAWTNAAQGDDKLERAHALASTLTASYPGAVLARVTGRLFPTETQPRFAFGVRWRDNGAPCGDGPLDGDPTASPPGPNDIPKDAPTELAPGDNWLTVTPDPGVIEVNLAPCATTTDLLDQANKVWSAAHKAGLSPIRYRYNGQIADSGGGGQLTLGGSRPDTSPFIRYPHVLPALIRYINNHPSLSYWFANECVGSASQGPRPDEGTRERYDELEIALHWLEQKADQGELSPELLWQGLGPLLVDASGNSHRAELNVEKLWNPHLPIHGMRHGKMGVVEFRSIKMPERPTMLAAAAVLMRSIVARLIVADYRKPLIDWHDDLHDRFALPSVLSRDLRRVLGDLDEHGLGVPGMLRSELEAWREPGILCNLGDAVLEIRPALEFWPLVGDVASQETASARSVDASTQRIEVTIDGRGPERIAIQGRWATLRPIGEGTRTLGIRRRIYAPQPGFHPGLEVTDPLVIEWSWQGKSQRIELWAWRPDGGAYAGLPVDAGDALDRRSERIAISTRLGDVLAFGQWRDSGVFTVDLRRG